MSTFLVAVPPICVHDYLGQCLVLVLFRCQVVCCGSFWRDLYENGTTGVYRRISETGSTAEKRADLNDPELSLGDDIVAA